MPKKKKINDFIETVDGLSSAWEELRRHPNKETTGIDGQNILSYSDGYTHKLKKLAEKLNKGTFHFSTLKRAGVENDREILIQTIEDRLVSKSLLRAVSYRFDKLNSNYDFSREDIYKDIEHEFEGIPLAVSVIQQYFKEGYVWVLEADIKGFFDNVSKDKIFKIVEKNIPNKKVVELIKEIIYFKQEKPNAKFSKSYSPDKGIAQGSSLSSILSSIYLYKFDLRIAGIPDTKIVRYVDDFIVLCKTEEQTKKVYEVVRSELKKLGLDMYALGELHPTKNIEKTKITLATGYGSMAFDFLGLRFNHTDVDISPNKKKDIAEDLKNIITSRQGLFDKIRKVKSHLVGYITHYRKAHYTQTIDSLLKIVNDAEWSLRSNYLSIHKSTIGKNVFRKVDSKTLEKLFIFMGIDFTELREKITKPLSTKKFLKR